MCEPDDDLYLHNILLGCAHEQNIHGLVGTVNRCGYGGQQKGTIVTLMDQVYRFEAYAEASFSPSSANLCAYKSLECLSQITTAH